jgi:hypothetical protein
MKSIFIISAVLLSILCSCGINSQNFNRQKFTNLKSIADVTEESTLLEEKQEAIKNVKASYTEENHEIEESATVSFQALIPEPQDSTLNKDLDLSYTPWIKRGIRRNNRFFIEKEGTIYLIENVKVNDSTGSMTAKVISQNHKDFLFNDQLLKIKKFTVTEGSNIEIKAEDILEYKEGEEVITSESPVPVNVHVEKKEDEAITEVKIEKEKPTLKERKAANKKLALFSGIALIVFLVGLGFAIAWVISAIFIGLNSAFGNDQTEELKRSRIYLIAAVSLLGTALITFLIGLGLAVEGAT